MPVEPRRVGSRVGFWQERGDTGSVTSMDSVQALSLLDEGEGFDSGSKCEAAPRQEVARTELPR